jgi:antitoxin component YwqK of YwqJK toxin-antitoxin module
MISNAFTAVFLFFFIAASAQEAPNRMDAQGKKQGKWIKKDDKGRKVYEGEFKNDQPIGEFKYYYDDGDIKTISIFSNQGSVSRSKHYFPGNILMAEGNYLNQKRDSVWKFYNAPNALVSEERYKNGKKHGVEKIYDGKGHLLEMKTWKDSLRDGDYKKYYDNGEVKEEGTCQAGLFEGMIKFYFPGNTPAVTGAYLHSLRHGKWIYHNPVGHTNVMIENYDQGNLHGYYAQWYEKDGTPKITGEYKQGRKHNLWKYYNDKGKITADTTFGGGYLQGACHTYYESGSKQSECNYYFSNKTGVSMEWDEKGNVMKEEKFPAIEELKKKKINK